MLTYYEVMTTDLSLLTAAADKWESMAGEIKKVEDRYGDSVQKITMGQNWTGISAGVAHTNFAATRYEYSAAQIQAKAIAGLLRDAHGQFTDLKNRLETARDKAIAAGMIVSEQGNVAFDYAKLTPSERSAYQHDPDGKAEVQKAVTQWQQHLDDCVKAVSEADQGVKIALDAVGVDSNKDAFGKGNDETYNGFNAGAQNDIEVYEARNAEDIATRINSGGNVSAADYAELDRSFRDNAGNRAFSQTFLSGIGPGGTITLTDKLNDRALHSDKKNSDRYQNLQKGLANTLAGATEVPGKVSDAPPGSKKFKEWLAGPDGKFYREFTDGLDKAGVAATGEKYNPLYGYQSFVNLMQHADTAFDDQFLYDLGDDLISAEKKHPGMFIQYGAGHDGIETDAIDGLLGVMSKNPDAATAFFDAKGNGPDGDKVTNDHLHYLAGRGNGTREWPHNEVLGYQVTTLDHPTSRVGLGLALEAAATGHTPLGPKQDPWPEMPHTDAQGTRHARCHRRARPLSDDSQERERSLGPGSELVRGGYPRNPGGLGLPLHHRGWDWLLPGRRYNPYVGVAEGPGAVHARPLGRSRSVRHTPQGGVAVLRSGNGTDSERCPRPRSVQPPEQGWSGVGGVQLHPGGRHQRRPHGRVQRSGLEAEDRLSRDRRRCDTPVLHDGGRHDPCSRRLAAARGRRLGMGHGQRHEGGGRHEGERGNRR
ncbi:hypothetical protein ACFV9E_27395 [Streptomyces sp. NPDC059835]|uniref:hypothetical protein n=1 Tax=Streptomyces sp. NPDC059835 TaxID=3346967 RepID=UPI0036653156